MVRKTGPQSGPGIDGERDGDDHQQSGSVDVLRSPRTPNLSQAVIEGADSGGSSATQSRPQTPVMPSGTPPPKISSPTPRRVLTITPAKKPPQSAVNVPVGTFSEAAKDSERRDATATPNIPDRDQAQAGKDKRERNGTALSVGIISAQANEKDGKVRDARRKASKIDSKVSSASEKMSEKAAEKETEKEAYTSLEQEEITTEKGRPLTPLSSPKMRKKRSKTKVDDAAGTQVVTVTGAAKDKDVVDHIPTPPPVEPEVEAIVSRKTKKRKEKKVAVRQAPKHVPLQARLSETQSQPLESSPAASQSANIIPNGLKEKLETLGLDFDRVPSTRAANNLGNLSSKLTEGSNLVESSKPQKKQQQAASLDRRVPASQPPPPRRDISVPRKPSRCQTQRHAGEVDITSFLTSHNAATGEVDLQIDSEALANALNQLGAGYGYSSYTVDHAGENGHVNVRIDVQGKTEAPAGGKEGKSTPGHTCTPEATASFDLSTLGINIGQLDQLAANLGSFSFGGAEPAHANNSCGDGTVNVNVNGVAMNIDANAFIDQALEGLATTAAFLYEGLEAQVEKVRREEEVKSKSKTKGKGEVGGPKSSMQRVSEQVTKLEEYAAKLQNKFRNGLDPAGESTASSTEHGVPGATVCGKKLKKAKGLGSSSGTGAGTRYTATFTVSSGSSARDTPIDQTSPISEMFGVGLNPATAGWTTEDWKAKCRSVEIVMKRVREAREMRRRQREEEPGTGTAADGSSQGLNMLDALSQAAIGAINGLDHGLESDHDEYPSNGDIDYGNIGDDEQSVTSSGFATPSATEASSPPTDAQNLFENNHIQRLLETVRILVSTGEMLVNAPSTAMMANTSDSTQPLHGLKKKKKRSSSPQPPQTYSNYGQGQELDASSGVGVLVDEHGRPMDATLMDVNGRGRGRIELTNVVAYNSQGELAPIVFDPAPLLAAVASGAVAPGVPIPWEVFGLRGPPPSWQGQSTEHPHSAGVPMDVEILERELEVSRREEQELEKRLVEVVRRNGQWQTEVAKVLELEVNVSDAYQVEVLHEQYEDAVEFDADEEFAEGAEQIACSHGVPMIGTR
ncbi:uncharacterized protein SPPG_07765 [Spizellomyces punctatus DAOM BR117]|uniref:Uncharacterized protein n=1 Tax=Spizellomyces punctatus (strain DAOM BR117) TaxID=645134 RepID=A0A0L0H6S4_SPIPD|nr:uncharacterized protein SPPG_07765 [Spizellomyces punctatus DAOM BR117]KNC96942.1 hypothetical protein SPPG_07765 [Spizellomyces punctatus DAOM BR117]|eukprot:XP_016604982.1 hypothetical protein SPPG_07765 [Spizellomyces punctatus DAOM BR117]